ncbi:MAG: hypothetical protein HOM14_03665 [Gammaproteobacteria bacterium]|jgi:hypothetical protein|nr:hypothetical protein [Gammaproteobacteria bacterium]MBT4075097.1 hypothetical protein [Gammaproteobacteria bacterium]MBT4196315.1 hypothetical protein [Gammaproteobacteria bacterium]MBT4451277.1 hypothetical protein [Gammaproteobacteria bacterium]MBT4859168.1 hypothetical protein [Gammaproteobacteria bacterium]
MKKAPTQKNEQRLNFNRQKLNNSKPRSSSKLTKIPSKLKRVTGMLMAEPLDFISAQLKTHDRSLHSTVSTIQNKWGIQVCRRRIKRSGYMGVPTACCEYRILPDQYEKARKAMKRMK